MKFHPSRHACITGSQASPAGFWLRDAAQDARARLFVVLAIHVQDQVYARRVHGFTVGQRRGLLFDAGQIGTLPVPYPAGMNPSQRDQLRRALEQRRETLVAELGGDEVRLREGGGDLEEADLSRDMGELNEIEAEPQAARCVECQRRHEKTYRR